MVLGEPVIDTWWTLGTALKWRSTPLSSEPLDRSDITQSLLAAC